MIDEPYTWGRVVHAIKTAEPGVGTRRSFDVYEPDRDKALERVLTSHPDLKDGYSVEAAEGISRSVVISSGLKPGEIWEHGT